MSEQEKYDELIRQKFAEKEFIFNEENWEKAEKILDLSKRSKKIFWWSSIFLTGLITGICVMFLLTGEKTHVMNKRTEPDLKNSNSLQHNSNSSGHKQNLNAPLEKSLIHETAPIDSIQPLEQDFNLNESGSSTNNNDKPVYASNVANRIPSKRATFKQTSSSFSLNSARIKHPSSVKTRKQKTANDIDEADNKNLLSDNSKESNSKNSHLLKSETGSMQKKSVKKNKGTSVLDSATPEALLVKKDLAANTKKEKTLTSSKKEGTNKSALAKKNSKTPNVLEKSKTATDSSVAITNVEIKDSATLELVTQKNLSTAADSLSDSVKQEEKKLVAADSLQPHADSVQTQHAIVAPLPMDGLASITLISIEAGINGQVGWKYEDNNQVEGRGITPILGIGVTHCFNQKWSLYSGLQYGSIAYLKASTKTYTATKYSFGSTTTETIIKPGILNYLVVPLQLQYHFNEKNAIFVGGTISFLLNKNNKTQSEYSQVAPVVPSTNNISAPYDLKTSTGYYSSSFNRLDAAIGLGYRRKINSHFSINAIANYGLLDIKRNSFFSQNKFERNSSLKLVLSYTIFDF